MIINWDSFTPLASLGGGILIGIAALFLMMTTGRVMGVSGILSGLFSAGEAKLWRLAFLGGTLLGPLLIYTITGTPIASEMVSDGWFFYGAAFLVGVGTVLGSGCTSGHGICGLARFSGRSLVAVITFMTMAVITVYIIRHSGFGG
jgi:uncharacterized membrane protein YedE/YeeE